MAKHSTNYHNTLVEIAEDSTSISSVVPPTKGDKKTVANLQFEMLYNNPYIYSSDDVLFGVFALRKQFEPHEINEQREAYFSKGQPCFRASPLTKQYSWGVHSNSEGKIALLAAESEAYKNLQSDSNVKNVKAMRSKRK